MSRKLKQRDKETGKHISLSEHAPERPDDVPPIFSFRYMAATHCITCCERDEKAAFAVRLRKLSELTWKQLRMAPRHGLGYEKIDSGSLLVPIPAFITDDVSFIAFRFDGLKPMIGFRDRDDMRIFHVVWLDRNFNTYNHG